MAESCTVAFGRYLRMLRERRGLSLEAVATMSRSLADPVDKSYLSRCENGRYGIGFSKVITLSRIYEVPTEVLAERMELDTELDRIGGPETEGLSHGELQKRGIASSRRGAVLDAYGYFRDAVRLAFRADLSPTFRDAKEQHLVACMNVSTAAGRLGRSRFALHEMEFIRDANHLGPGLEPLLLELLSRWHRVLGHVDEARLLADEAVRKAEVEGSATTRAYAYANRARLAYHDQQYRAAIPLYQAAFKAYRDAALMDECARTHLNLANAYYGTGRTKSAKRALAAAERLAASVGDTRVRALLRMLAGEIEETEGRPSAAIKRWREALDMAKNAKDKILQFKAEFLLFRQAWRSGEESTSKALGRRLVRLAAWIPQDVEELAEFRQLASEACLAPKKRVPFRQH